MKSREEWKSRRLSDADIKGILYLIREGSASQRDIAKLYSITQAYVSRLKNGKASRVVVGN